MESAKIYKLICPLNKVPIYIGKTIKSLEERLNRHICKTKSKIKYNKKLSRNENWIKKLIDLSLDKNIKIELIEECNLETINEKEIYWISFYKKNYKLNNLTDGGDGGINYIHTAESLKKMSENRKGKCKGEEHPFFNKPRTEETKRKISEAVKGEKHPFFGRERSEETKLKIGNANRGENNGMYGFTYSMPQETKDKISEILRNSDKLKESRNSEEFKKKISDYFSIPLVLYDLDMNFLMEFKNCRECAEYFNYTVGNVKNAVRDGRMLGRKYWIKRKI